MVQQLGTYQARSYALADGERLTIECDADQMLITELSESNGVTLRLNHGPDGIAFPKFEARGPIRHIDLANASGGAITFTIATAKGLIVADRRVSVVGDSAPVVVESPETLVSTADQSVAATTSAQLLAASSTRREVLVQNLDTTLSVRVGDSNVAAGRGLELAPGDVLTLTTQAAIHCHNPNGSAVSIALLHTAAI